MGIKKLWEALTAISAFGGRDSLIKIGIDRPLDFTGNHQSVAEQAVSVDTPVGRNAVKELANIYKEEIKQ